MQYKLTLFLFTCLFWACNTIPKNNPTNEFYSLLNAIEKGDSAQVDNLWNEIKDDNQPFIWGDSVAFIYRGEAESVEWNGDFNRWSRETSFNNQGEKISNSNFWILTTKFPSDARLDYKVVIDGNWMIDPNNSKIQMTGVGGIMPNSEIRMPDYKPSLWVIDKAVNKGSLSDWERVESKNLGYDINYKVFLPYGYSSDQKYETIYFTDGHEYSHPQLGSAIEILDNLIESEKIKPVIAIFIDPRDPDNLQLNKRMSEMALNDDYRKFISEELVSLIDTNYPTLPQREFRTIAGTSLGGLTSTYVAAESSNVFGKTLIQSAAYAYKPDIYDIVSSSQQWPVKVSITTGTFYDALEESLQMKAIYQKNLDTIQLIVINEGHSWGNFRAVLADQLIYLLGK